MAERVRVEVAGRVAVVTLARPEKHNALDPPGEIAARSPDAVRAAKRLYDAAWPAGATDGLALERELQRSLIGTANQLAAVGAGADPDPGMFVDPGVPPRA